MLVRLSLMDAMSRNASSNSSHSIERRNDSAVSQNGEAVEVQRDEYLMLFEVTCVRRAVDAP